jgi:hypothetical protein
VAGGQIAQPGDMQTAGMKYQAGSSPRVGSKGYDGRFAQVNFNKDAQLAKQDSRIRRLQNVETKFDRVASGTSTGASIPSTLGVTGSQAMAGALNRQAGAQDRRKIGT